MGHLLFRRRWIQLVPHIRLRGSFPKCKQRIEADELLGRNHVLVESTYEGLERRRLRAAPFEGVGA